jgi:enoyl-CoA hydratase/carnithine racemase
VIRVAIADAIATVTLSHPPVNAVSLDWLARFNGELDAITSRSDWHVLHIRSEQKVFCAGADLREMQDRFRAADGPDETLAYVATIQRLYARIEALPQVTVAEIGGAAIGGGLELALACDLRIAAAEAKLGLPEARLGLLPGAGGTQRLTRLCGRSVSSRLILGAEVVDGTTAAALGLVHWAVPRTELASRARELAQRVAGLPAAALAACKDCITAAGEPGRGGYTLELEHTRRLFMAADTQQRVAAFLDGSLR